MIARLPLAFALAALLAGCAIPPAPPPQDSAQAPARGLKVASWNLEFLAEKDGAGCKPRTGADYAAMRAIADGLDADVIAFQEAESIAAAARVFDPERYTIVMEKRPGVVSGTCGGNNASQMFIRQAVGFAIRKDLKFDRHADVTDLQLGNPNLRSAVDITVRPANGQPLRLLSIHLKSGCFAGSQGPACESFLPQVPVLERWIDTAAAGPTRFIVLGDWNRRLAGPNDPVWAELDDGDPANADLMLADQGIRPKCDPRYQDFIDHIVLDRRATLDFNAFAETPYATATRYSDHCPIAVQLAR
ncbi:endonuclease/exonuclease/phosphatase family protein [Sphingomonas soli]|uniref:endonuclease/exonuclease/phosphatase family protein n=1 Tax=Sphingomonas soli TaxID=266127 RepID=UPI0008325E79|nr:endonuclease/exonuclease/phosphatase family protein [Sphingomonas soli]